MGLFYLISLECNKCFLTTCHSRSYHFYFLMKVLNYALDSPSYFHVLASNPKTSMFRFDLQLRSPISIIFLFRIFLILSFFLPPTYLKGG